MFLRAKPFRNNLPILSLNVLTDIRAVSPLITPIRLRDENRNPRLRKPKARAGEVVSRM